MFRNSVVHFKMLETFRFSVTCLYYIVVFYAVKNGQVIIESFVNTAVEISEPKVKFIFGN
jgi:hypothetical protein